VGKKTGPNPTDRGKCGTKLSLATDAAGVPLAVVLAGANRNDHTLLGETLAGAQTMRPRSRRCDHGLCLDKGYDYPVTRWLAATFRYRLHLRCRGEDRPRRRWQPRRWVVERTHSWCHRARRLLIRWEKKAHNFLAFVHLTCAFITSQFL
jgi:transposase